MNVNTTMGNTQPSFKAILRKNEHLDDFARDMNSSVYKDFTKVLDKLDKVSPGDVLEIHKNTDDSKLLGYGYYLRNIDKKDSDVFLTGGATLGSILVKKLENVVKPKTEETNKLLKEPVTKDNRNLFEKIGDFFKGSDFDDPTEYPR